MNANSSTQNIIISVGEASADVYAANLIRELKTKNPSLNFSGMGGDLMRQAGAAIVVDQKELSIIGITEVISKLWLVIKSFKAMRQELISKRPALLILIDYPGFNLRLAKAAKKLNIKVLYYISPQIWAWHASRIHKIKKLVDHMAVILPFETAIYEKAGVPVTFVGHPLLTKVKPTRAKETIRKELALDQNTKIVGLFPGSRLGEISRLLPVMLAAAKILQKEFKEIEFVLPIASSLNENDIAPFLNTADIKVHIIKNETYNTIQTCDAIIACSGTVTLEIGLMGVPFVLIYKVSALNYFIGKRVIKVPFIGLCNLIANKKITEELIQANASPEKIGAEIAKILQDTNYRANMSNELLKVRASLNAPNKKSIADIVRLLIQ